MRNDGRVVTVAPLVVDDDDAGSRRSESSTASDGPGLDVDAPTLAHVASEHLEMTTRRTSRSSAQRSRSESVVVAETWSLWRSPPSRAIAGFLYKPLLRDVDSPLTRSRKLGISTLMPMAAVALFLVIYNLTADGVYFNTGGKIGSVLAPLPILIGWPSVYAVVRRTGKACDFIVSINAACLLLTVSMITISFPDFPLHVLWITALMLVYISRAPRPAVWTVIVVVGYAVAVTNDAAFPRGEPVVATATLPGPLQRGHSTNLVMGFVALFASMVVTISLATQMYAHDDALARAEASMVMTHRVVELLGGFDTASTWAVLQRAEEVGRVDTELVDAFRALIAHLDQYRPHLPNWVLSPNNEGVDDFGIADAESEGATPQANDDVAEDKLQHSLSSIATSTTSHRGPDSLAQSPSDHAINVTLRRALAKRGSMAARAGTKCCLAYIDLTFRDAPRGGGGIHRVAQPNGTPQQPVTLTHALNAIVDHTHYLAKHTSAAVHSFVGDRIIISWGAAAFSDAVYLKAARFFLRWKNAPPAGSSLVAVSGAVECGTANTLLAGSGQQALMLHATWLPSLDALAAAARFNSVFVVSDSIRQHTAASVVYRPVVVAVPERLSVVSNGTPQHPTPTVANAPVTSGSRAAALTRGASDVSIIASYHSSEHELLSRRQSPPVVNNSSIHSTDGGEPDFISVSASGGGAYGNGPRLVGFEPTTEAAVGDNEWMYELDRHRKMASSSNFCSVAPQLSATQSGTMHSPPPSAVAILSNWMGGLLSSAMAAEQMQSLAVKSAYPLGEAEEPETLRMLATSLARLTRRGA
jgi:hypothetical protein